MTAYAVNLSAVDHLLAQKILWIAATATAHDLILVTNDMREFGRVIGLQIENWEKG
jgi:predicted nucleic acid-binding protein